MTLRHYITAFLAGGIILLLAGGAWAQTFCETNPSGTIDRPAPGFDITSNMGRRDTGIEGASKMHRGTDYGTPCGTGIQGPPAGCVNIDGGSKTNERGGYGYAAKFDCGNGIQIQYAHLNNASSYSPATNIIRTGNSGVGGCHLDYILTIDGKAVDAQCATGNVGMGYTYGKSSTEHGIKCPTSGRLNLCDPATRQALLDHSDRVFEGHANQTYNVTNGATAPNGTTGDTGTDPGISITINLGTKDGSAFQQDAKPGSVLVPGSDVLNNPEEDKKDKPDPADKYEQTSSKPRCNNSTCITTKMIKTAAHEDVAFDDVVSNKETLLPPKEGEECKLTHKTGFDVQKQFKGEIRAYSDAFCPQQGCSYRNEGGSGEGKCE